MPGIMTIPRVVRCLTERLRRVAGWSAMLAVLLLPMAAQADLPQWAYRTFPFAQALNVDAVYDVTHSKPENLINTIRRWGG